MVRDIRSSFGYIEGDFKTYALDIGSVEYDAFIKSDERYDYVLNLSALKHVRSEEDPFTLMRMIDVNIFNTDETIRQFINNGTKKYFRVGDVRHSQADISKSVKLLGYAPSQLIDAGLEKSLD